MKTFYEAILAHGGFAGDVFDIAAGPVNLDIIDVLLSIGDGTPTQNIPLNIISTGSLNGYRTLSLSGVEQNGRMFFLSLRNTDLADDQFYITITATTDINGQGPNFIVNKHRDYIFVHETNGTWRVYKSHTPDNYNNIVTAKFTGVFNTSAQEVPLIVIDNNGDVVVDL